MARGKIARPIAAGAGLQTIVFSQPLKDGKGRPGKIRPRVFRGLGFAGAAQGTRGQGSGIVPIGVLAAGAQGRCAL